MRSLTDQDLEAIAKKVARIQSGPPFVPFNEWYNAWCNCLDGAYTIGSANSALKEWLIENYLDGKEGVIHLGAISREQAEEDTHWIVESFNAGEWPDYYDVNEILQDLACTPFDQFDDEVKFVEYQCYR